MTTEGRPLPGSNPFSTRFIRAGAIPFQYPPGESGARLVERLAAADWRGQIIGPHGSGKSTLLAELIACCARQARRSWLIVLRDGQRWLPRSWHADARRLQARLIVVDGYEQLGWWSRAELKLRCRQRGWGLLVTAHRDVGLPTLFETSVSLPMAESIVDRLVASSDATISREAIAESFAATHGNLREMLLSLYDRYESEHRGG